MDPNKTLKRKAFSMEAELQNLRKRMRRLEQEMVSQANTHVASPASPSHVGMVEDWKYENHDNGRSDEDEEHEEYLDVKSPLSLLETNDGEGPTKEPRGEKVHESVAESLRNIIAKGLSVEQQASLMQKYPSPENVFVTAPDLNREIASSLTEQHRSRDKKLVIIQNKLGASLSAFSKALTLLLKEQGSKNIQLIELLSDALRVIADAHYSESLARRALVSINLNKNFKETIMQGPIDESLFGKDLAERMSAAKTLERTSAALKVTGGQFKKSTKVDHVQVPRNSASLNAKSLPRTLVQSRSRGRLTRTKDSRSYTRNPQSHSQGRFSSQRRDF